MPVEAVDRVLAQWRAELDAIQANLLEFEDMMMFRIMKEKAHADELAGLTKQTVFGALSTVEKLWTGLVALEAVYKAAKEKRDKLPRFGKGKVVEEIERLLSAAIVLETHEVPFDQRGLFASGERTTEARPAELKTTMARSFESARNVFVELQRHTTALHEELEGTTVQIEGLQAREAACQSTRSTELAELAAAFAVIDDRRKRDPLSMTTTIQLQQELRPYIVNAKARVQELERGRSTVRTDLDAAAKNLAMLGAQARSDLRRDDAALTRPLANSLAKLEWEMTGGRWAAARNGLIEWRREAEALGAIIAELKRSHVVLETVKTKRTQCLELMKRCDASIDRPAGLIAPESTKAISERLHNLTTTLLEGRVDDARAAFTVWQRDCNTLSTSLDRAIAANGRPLDKLWSLKDRWATAQRKTEEAKRRGLVVGKALATFGERAAALMSASRIDLEEAERMVYAYETRLEELVLRL